MTEAPSQTEPPDFIQHAGLSPDQVPAIVRAYNFSQERLFRTREIVADVEKVEGCWAAAVGSLARHEASGASDCDLELIREIDCPPERTEKWGENVREELRKGGFDVTEKTFGRVIERSHLLQDIGGAEERNAQFTHRILMLTEHEWLSDKRPSELLRRAILAAYSSGERSRGRLLTSLSNDLHRYYRTLCVDYRHKVEEVKKAPALRVMKLRHSRKTWHLSHVALQCAGAANVKSQKLTKDEHLGFVSQRVGDPPLKRLVFAMRDLGKPTLCGDVLLAYNQFLEEIAVPEVRDTLEQVETMEQRESDPVYTRLRANAQSLQEAADRILEFLLKHAGCSDYMRRYVIL